MAAKLTNQVNNQSLIPSTNALQLTLTLNMTTVHVVETSVTDNNSPIQNYTHPDDHIPPNYDNYLFYYAQPQDMKLSETFWYFHEFTVTSENIAAIAFRAIDIVKSSIRVN